MSFVPLCCRPAVADPRCAWFRVGVDTGGIFAKYEFGAAPQKRFVWLSDDLSYLHWKVLGIVKNYSTVLVRDIIGVVQGAKTPVLKDHGKDGKSRGEGITCWVVRPLVRARAVGCHPVSTVYRCVYLVCLSFECRVGPLLLFAHPEAALGRLQLAHC